MHIGLGLQFANLDRQVTDAEVYRRELGLAARAEEAGFDSVWVSEHHFSDYQLTSQQSMVLSWLAAQTDAGQARHVRDRPAVARPGAGGGDLRRARPPLRRAGHPRPRPGPRAEGVRRLPGADGRVAAPLHRVHRGPPRGARDRRTSSTTASSTSSPASTIRPRRSPASRAARSPRRCRRSRWRSWPAWASGSW